MKKVLIVVMILFIASSNSISNPRSKSYYAKSNKVLVIDLIKNKKEEAKKQRLLIKLKRKKAKKISAENKQKWKEERARAREAKQSNLRTLY